MIRRDPIRAIPAMEATISRQEQKGEVDLKHGTERDWSQVQMHIREDYQRNVWRRWTHKKGSSASWLHYISGDKSQASETFRSCSDLRSCPPVAAILHRFDDSLAN